jgi:hypothetical protein
MLQSNGKWARYAFLKWRGCALNFFISVQYDFEASTLQLLFFWLFTLNKFYRFWNSAFVAFEIVQNEWEMSKI